jgi:hypothetical protein
MRGMFVCECLLSGVWQGSDSHIHTYICRSFVAAVGCVNVWHVCVCVIMKLPCCVPFRRLSIYLCLCVCVYACMYVIFMNSM